MPLNALVGGIIGGTIIERYGRKKTIMATGPPYILCKNISRQTYSSLVAYLSSFCFCLQLLKQLGC